MRNVLLARAERAGVVLAPAREVADVSFIDEAANDPAHAWMGDPGNRAHYDPRTSTVKPAGLAEVAHADPTGSGALLMPGSRAVIIASGGEPFPSLGELGLITAPRTPVLCPLACEDSPLAALDGRRSIACANLTKAGAFFPSWHERGEVLFRSYGISGILTFDLSRRAEAGDLVELDLAPDVTPSELRQLVDPFAHGSFEPGCLDGVLDPEIARLLERLARERWHIDWPERAVPASDSEALLSLVKALPLIVVGPTETAHAQVPCGGLLTSQFSTQTLAAEGHPWLFACGEALDVDADCGGFNLAWAWKSGMVAGAAAARMAWA